MCGHKHISEESVAPGMRMMVKGKTHVGRARGSLLEASAGGRNKPRIYLCVKAMQAKPLLIEFTVLTERNS